MSPSQSHHVLGVKVAGRTLRTLGVGPREDCVYRRAMSPLPQPGDRRPGSKVHDARQAVLSRLLEQSLGSGSDSCSDFETPPDSQTHTLPLSVQKAQRHHTVPKRAHLPGEQNDGKSVMFCLVA